MSVDSFGKPIIVDQASALYPERMNATRFSRPTFTMFVTEDNKIDFDLGWPVGGNWQALAKAVGMLVNGGLTKWLQPALAMFGSRNPREASGVSSFHVVLTQLAELKAGKSDEDQSDDDENPMIKPSACVPYNIRTPRV